MAGEHFLRGGSVADSVSRAAVFPAGFSERNRGEFSLPFFSQGGPVGHCGYSTNPRYWLRLGKVLAKRLLGRVCLTLALVFSHMGQVVPARKSSQVRLRRGLASQTESWSRHAEE